MNLFIFNPSTFEVDISPEVLFLKPFAKIVSRDKTELKTRAKAELAYIYFLCDFESDFQATIDVSDRKEDIRSTMLGLPSNWKEDKLIIDACIFYKKHSATIASVALESQRENIYTLIKKVGKFMKSDDAAEVQKATVMSAKVNTFIKDIDELEKIVKGQREIATRHKGSQEKAMYEDG